MNDRFTVRAVVLSLAIIAMGVILGAIYLAATSHPIPDPLWGIAGTAVGAVAGILARTNTEPDLNVQAVIEAAPAKAAKKA